MNMLVIEERNATSIGRKDFIMRNTDPEQLQDVQYSSCLLYEYKQ
jgi:hypothetical protein